MSQDTREQPAGRRSQTEQSAHQQERPTQPPEAPSAGPGLAEQRILQALQEGQFDNLPGAGRPAELPPLARLLNPQDLAEQRIQQAISDGLFDNLPGAGKPLDLDDDRAIPDDLKMAYRVMKAQGLKPLWIELRDELRQELERYKTWRAGLCRRWPALSPRQQQEALTSLRSQVGALNTLIHSINATVPSDSLRLGLLVYEQERAGLS